MIKYVCCSVNNYVEMVCYIRYILSSNTTRFDFGFHPFKGRGNKYQLNTGVPSLINLAPFPKLHALSQTLKPILRINIVSRQSKKSMCVCVCSCMHSYAVEMFASQPYDFTFSRTAWASGLEHYEEKRKNNKLWVAWDKHVQTLLQLYLSMQLTEFSFVLTVLNCFHLYVVIKLSSGF